jgi:hypothetical protein
MGPTLSRPLCLWTALSLVRERSASPPRYFDRVTRCTTSAPQEMAFTDSLAVIARIHSFEGIAPSSGPSKGRGMYGRPCTPQRTTRVPRRDQSPSRMPRTLSSASLRNLSRWPCSILRGATRASISMRAVPFRSCWAATAVVTPAARARLAAALSSGAGRREVTVACSTRFTRPPNSAWGRHQES